MFERFTNQSRRAVVLAQEEARELHHSYIGTEHLLLGMLREGTGSAARALTSMDVTLDAARQAVEASVGRGKHQQPSGHIPFTPRAKKALELALRESLQLGQNYIGTGHLLLGLVTQGDDVAIGILGQLHADVTDLRTRAIRILAEDPATLRDTERDLLTQRTRILAEMETGEGPGTEGSAGTGTEGLPGTGPEGPAGTGTEGLPGTGTEGSAGTGTEGPPGTGTEGPPGNVVPPS
jgi:ATP-dependent Clp protease ATP-binding subunit ClpA